MGRFRLRPPGVFVLGLIAGVGLHAMGVPGRADRPTWGGSRSLGSSRLMQSAFNDARRAAITQRTRSDLLVLDGNTGEGTWTVCEKDGTTHPRGP
jgi:hypothetical protein